MATTTTYYGFDIPQSSDLVKNGATAIATLGQDIDTAMNTALGTKKSGLVLLNTTSFSGAVSHSFGSDAAPVFTSSFTNYRIIFNDLAAASSSTAISFRLRANTTDNTGNGYAYQSMTATGTTQTNARTFSSSWKIADAGSGTNEISSAIVELQNPQVLKFHEYMSNNMYILGGTGPLVQLYNGYETTNGTAYNGFTIFGSVNISGTLSVYGYNK